MIAALLCWMLGIIIIQSNKYAREWVDLIVETALDSYVF
jgi:hypothetical protein